MTGLRHFFGWFCARYLERKSKNKLVSILQSFALFALFCLGLFVAYLRFTRTF